MKYKNFLRLLSIMLLVLLCMSTYGQNNALHFDGVNDYVALSHFERPTEFTVEFWIKTNVTSHKTILSWTDASDSDTFVTELSIENEGISYTESTSTDYSGHYAGYYAGDIADGGWYHVAVVRKAYPGGTSTDPNIFLYVDGNLLGSWKGIDINDNSNSTFLTLGAYKLASSTGGYQQHITATMDELRVWDYAKNQTEIQAQMNGELTGNEANYSDLLAYYPFNQGDANQANPNETTLLDYSQYRRDGELTNFSLEEGVISNWVGGVDYTTLVNGAFITTWQVNAGETITIPINQNYTYNYTVNWGDNNEESGLNGKATHTYQTAGEKTVSITGDFPMIYFNNDDSGDPGEDKEKILSVDQWGYIQWKDMLNAFYGCSNLDITATDAPNLKNVTDMRGMFRNSGVTGEHTDINSWDVSSVEQMEAMFSEASDFNADLSDWDLGSVTNSSMTDIFFHTGMDCDNYSATLIGWADKNNNVTDINLGNVSNANNVRVYSPNASTARQILIGKGWVISGDALGTTACTLFEINAIADLSISENTAYTSVIPTIIGTPIGTVTWTLGGADAEDFSVNDATGQVEMIARDLETPQDANTDNVYEVTITATDSDNNSANQDWTVTVTCLPMAIAQDITVELDTSGQGFITPEQVNDGSGGGCTGSVDLSLNRSYFSCEDVGTPVTVTLTVVDQDNKSATATAQVTVKDVVGPTVVTQDITVALDANGQATISAQEIDHGSFDACTDIDSMTLDISSFDCPELGDATVTLTVTDTAGNPATGTATVTITAIDTNNNHIADICEPLVIAPGGFSPNGDGIGDTWVVENMEEYPDNTVQVFNQWGEPVFEANGYQNDWNGISNKTRNGNKKLPVGAYLYIINLNKPGIASKKGWLYINY